jgi:hypothetical protein
MANLNLRKNLNQALSFRQLDGNFEYLDSVDVSLASVVASADSSLSTRVSNEESTRTSADASIIAVITANESANDSADASLTVRVSAEESTRTSADASIVAVITANESANDSADASLTTRVSNEESTRAAADTSIVALISNNEVANDSADLSLTTRLSTEEVARAAADSTEASVRFSADASIVALISNNEVANDSADLSLTTRVSNEESVRTSADASIVALISGNESANDSADTSLTTRISAEESVRASVDTSLANLIAANNQLDINGQVLDLADETLTIEGTSQEVMVDTSVDGNGNVTITVGLEGTIFVDTNGEHTGNVVPEVYRDTMKTVYNGGNFGSATGTVTVTGELNNIVVIDAAIVTAGVIDLTGVVAGTLTHFVVKDLAGNSTGSSTVTLKFAAVYGNPYGNVDLVLQEGEAAQIYMIGTGQGLVLSLNKAVTYVTEYPSDLK